MKLTIKRILHSLGATGNYIGFHFLIAACELVLEDETRLLYVSNEIYGEIAKRFDCEIATVERNIRTVVLRSWDRQPARMIEIAGCALTEAPAVAEFIDYLTTYIQRTELAGSMR